MTILCWYLSKLSLMYCHIYCHLYYDITMSCHVSRHDIVTRTVYHESWSIYFYTIFRYNNTRCACACRWGGSGEWCCAFHCASRYLYTSVVQRQYCLWMHTHTHTHTYIICFVTTTHSLTYTHTHIYIYIYIYIATLNTYIRM